MAAAEREELEIKLGEENEENYCVENGLIG